MSARILVVDDVPANTRLLEAKLATEYYQVAAAQDGASAVALANSWRPDLVLLDVMMPGMDGFEVCQRLKNDPATMHLPIVMITALGESAERVRGLEAGADDFLTKPVDDETLFVRVRALVRFKRLLDEWRIRGETARALGMTWDPMVKPAIDGARALVVDDWDLGAEAVQKALSSEDVLAARARSEAEARALVGSVPFDLIVLSLSLGQDDALRLASRLRAEDATRETPLLLIAEPEQKQLLLRGFELGANDYVMRPMDENELRARVRNQIRRKFYQDQLRADLGQALEMALTDALTGLYNRRYLMRHLQGLLAPGASAGGVAALMIDLDRFKEINDRWGHPAGDAALRAVALSLRANVRVFDSVARFGGEEFVVVLPATTADDAVVAADRLRAAIAGLVWTPAPGVVHPLSVSIGVAACDPGTITPEELLGRADTALYAAKRAGRNRVEIAA